MLSALAATEAAQAQDAAVVQPRAYRVVLENARVRVLEFNSKPGMAVCGIGMHSHPAHLTIPLTASKARAKLPDGTVRTGARQPGEVFWSEAETHEVENISDKDMRLLIVEIKPAPSCSKA